MNTGLKDKVRNFLTRYKLLKMGMLLILLAVLLSFLSITNEIGEMTEQGIIDDGGYYYIEWRDGAINSTMKIEYVVDHNNTIENKTATINITDENFNNLHSINVSAEVEKSIEIDNSARYITADFPDGGIHYEQRIVFNYQPYRLLSIPALLMTMIGIVLFYKGKQKLMQEKFGNK